MSCLISMCVFSTQENNKDACLAQTLESLRRTVDFSKHRLMLSVNGFTEETTKIINEYLSIIELVVMNEENLGTAEGVNKIWQHRKLGEGVIKMDDDIVIYQSGWIDLMEDAISRDPQIGIIGLKRRDLIQSPWHEDPQYKSEAIILPHQPGQRWLTIERTADIIGSCTMFNPLLLDKVGYSLQPGKYGFEDNLFCHRSHLAGFYNCFLANIDIEHIDPGGTDFQSWKEKHSSELFPEYHKLVHDMIEGKESIYYNPFEK